MHATAAQIAIKGGAHLRFCWLWRFVQKRLRAHNHAIHAIAALRGLLINEGLLQFGGLVQSAEPFKRGNVLAGDSANRRHARAHGLTIHKHGASAAL